MPLNDRHYRESEEDWIERTLGKEKRAIIKEEYADDIRDMARDAGQSLIKKSIAREGN